MNYSTKFFVSALAHRINSVIAQRAFVNSMRDEINGILKNTNLDKALWYELFNGAKVDIAVSLASLPLDEEQTLLVSKDKRKTVKHVLLRNAQATFSDKVCNSILESKWFAPEYATTWLKAKLVPAKFIKSVAKIDNNVQAIKCMSDRDLYSTEEVIENLKEVRIINQVIVPYLIDTRPELVPLLVESERQPLLHAISSSQWLIDVTDMERIFYRLKAKRAPMHSLSMSERETLGNLIANPNTPLTLATRIYEFMESEGKIVGISRWESSKAVFRERLTLFPNVEYLIKGGWSDCTDEKVRKFLFKCVASADYNKFPSLRSLVLSEYYNINNMVNQSTRKDDIAPLDIESSSIAERGFDPRSLSTDVVTYVENELDSYGIMGWELFWFLAKSHEGSLAELILQAKTLNKE